ncbi:TetR/AcrR family transcriptional regulator [Paenibacillus kobensis]|uniref:TetR/AcrR family transcriptional regulator n=1 Tax=Paenibacillus kobensis TaxID=59841 RepID=UPI0013E307F5|nr:TetR family transcriptional regulator [Paenibacillus kobensis]
MPPKAELTKEKIAEAAFELVREHGFEALTARRIAQHLNCSTHPIYGVYGNMDAIKDDVYQLAVDYTIDYISKYEDSNNARALNLTLGMLLFAQHEKQLFRVVYLSDYTKHYLTKSHHKLREMMYSAIKDIDSRLQSLDESTFEQIFMSLSIFIIGMGTMINSNTLELDIREAESMLIKLYESVVLREGIEKLN